MDSENKIIQLGKTGLLISPMGVGAWQWGDRMFWGFGRGYGADDTHAAYKSSLAAGINFIDTAEMYGIGQSERYLGKYMEQTPELDTVIATKFFPFPWRLTKGSLRRALKGSLKRMGLQQVDLYQMHWPYGPVQIETWADALADVLELGLTKAVGVSNYNLEQMQRSYKTLSRRGISLASNQVEYNLINRKVELDGLLKTCREMKVTLIAYSPLAKGVLTGKYTPDNPPPGLRSQRYDHTLLEKIQPLLRMMRKIGREVGETMADEKSAAQVALNWLICKGVVPIPGAKNQRQAEENAGALGWRLSEDQVNILDEISMDITV